MQKHFVKRPRIPCISHYTVPDTVPQIQHEKQKQITLFIFSKCLPFTPIFHALLTGYVSLYHFLFLSYSIDTVSLFHITCATNQILKRFGGRGDRGGGSKEKGKSRYGLLTSLT